MSASPEVLKYLAETIDFSRGWPAEPYVLEGVGQQLAGALGLGEIASWESFSDLVSYGNLSANDVRVVREGKHIPTDFLCYPDSDRAAAGRINAHAISKAFENGYTLILNDVQRLTESLSLFVRSLASELTHPVLINAYLTPRESRGFPPHADGTHNWLLQVEGSKDWKLWQPSARPSASEGDPWMSVTLRRGDVLWIPMGWTHTGVARDEPSAHLTLTIDGWRQSDLVEMLGRAMAARRGGDAFLAPHVLADPATLNAVAQEALRDLKNFEDVALVELFDRASRERVRTSNRVDLRSVLC